MTETTNTPTRRRRLWMILIAAGAIVLVTTIVLGGLARGQGAAAAQTPVDSITAATLGDITASVSTSGDVRAARDARLSLKVAGTVQKVFVETGDVVQAGDTLVQLDTADLARDVASAEQNLAIQEASLAELKGGATPSELAAKRASLASALANLADVQDGADEQEIAAARASLSAAQVAYADLQDGPDAEKVAQALAGLKNAEAAVQKAQAAYDKVASHPDIGMLQQSVDLQQATNNYASAEASYRQTIQGATREALEQARASVEQARSNLSTLLAKPTAADLAAAEAQVKQAEAQLADLTNGATAEQLIIAEAQVAQARINLHRAQASLEDATLRAPFAGVITAVHVVEGEFANGPAVDLTDLNSLQVVLDVDEVDLRDLVIGQPAIVTLETWPEAPVTGHISAIAPTATANNGVVSYAVTVTLDKTGLPLRTGMTADAGLITATRRNVLVVPNQAITPVRAEGKYYVELVDADGTGTRRVEVTIGLKDNDHTEVTGGIVAGDQVVIRSLTQTATNAATNNSLIPPRNAANGFGGQ